MGAASITSNVCQASIFTKAHMEVDVFLRRDGNRAKLRVVPRNIGDPCIKILYKGTCTEVAYEEQGPGTREIHVHMYVYAAQKHTRERENIIRKYNSNPCRYPSSILLCTSHAFHQSIHVHNTYTVCSREVSISCRYQPLYSKKSHSEHHNFMTATEPHPSAGQW